MMFRKIIGIYCEHHTKHTNSLCGKTQNFIILQHVVHGITIIGKKRKTVMGDLYSSAVVPVVVGHAVAQLVEALRYKPKRRGFNFSLTIVSVALWPWGRLSL
jgi:hypothetical protein